MANSLGVKTKANEEKIDLIYAIIGAESDQASAAPAAPKKRGRKSKAEKAALEAANAATKTEAATQDETSSTADASAQDDKQAATSGKRRSRKAAGEAEPTLGIDVKSPSELTPEEKQALELQSAPKKRGRKSKADIG